MRNPNQIDGKIDTTDLPVGRKIEASLGIDFTRIRVGLALLGTLLFGAALDQSMPADQTSDSGDPFYLFRRISEEESSLQT